MTSFNKVILIGNLTKDPEVRYTPSGTSVCNFGLAVNHRYKQGEETRDDVCFIDIVVFGKQGENCAQYLSKGQGALIEGRLQQRRWESEDGQKRNRHEIIAQMVRFLPKRQAAPQDGGGSEIPFEEGNVPF
ncbi:MAG: single-stranded DNA-binding protein [Nitrospiria bacterium]